MPLGRLKRHLKERARQRDRAHKLYVAAVGQAREPAFYTDCGIADTIDGRFDLIVLHVFLVLRDLRRAGEPGIRLGDLVFKVLVDDMDLSLREMGVGDLGVGKRVKAMARAFYGRAKAYELALELERTGTPSAEQALEAVLRRNVYGRDEPGSGQLEALAAYVRAVDLAFANQPIEALFDGQVRFARAPDGSTATDPHLIVSDVLERVDP